MPPKSGELSTAFLSACDRTGVDSVHRERLWQILKRWPESGSEVERIRLLMEDYGHWRLFELSRTGDVAAAHRFERHWRKVALRFLGKGFTREQVEEFTAAFFERVYTRLESFHWKRPFGPYLRVILVNLARDELRRLRRSARYVEDLGETSIDQHAETGRPTPEDELLLAEQRARVQRALAELAPADRHLILECLVEGNSGREVALAMGLRPMALYQRLHRAKKRLRAILERDVSSS